jgi:ribosomal peptide maturation radical SAM protein 1
MSEIVLPVESHEQHDVLLISMPFGIIDSPSIALGLLKGSLLPLNISVKALYFTLLFAEIISYRTYDDINRIDITSLAGEWIFAEALSGAGTLDTEGYCNDVLRRLSPAYSRQTPISEDEIKQYTSLAEKVNSFLDECVEQVLAQRPRIVGFTSVFQQQVASLALAKRLKAVDPDVFIVFGGANCEGAMGAEMVRQFPFIDAVVSGEGDIIFPTLVQRVLQGQPIFDLQGVYTRRKPVLLSPDERYPTAPSVRRMDDLPYPDFDDFFQQLQTSSHKRISSRVRMPYETSRGCWWGEKNHCTFCGLNGSTMTYRSKSAKRALEELVYLTNRHPGYRIGVVDNILDMKYFKDFVPMLAERALDTKLFYEVKANLKKEQLQMLHDAGITTIQPGIESLSDDILKLMRKGVKGLQNIQLLKWCDEIGIYVEWNMLWGFPSEAAVDYTKMAELIPLLHHLQPPNGISRIRLDRFSPNFDEAEQVGFTNVTPYSSYSYIYPLAGKHVANLAYFFTYEYLEPQEVKEGGEPIIALRKEINEWISKADTEFLWMEEIGSSLFILDGRKIATRSLTILTGLQKALYLFCDSAHSKSQLQDFVAEYAHGDEAKQDSEALLQPLVENSLMIHDGNSYLSLAVSTKVLSKTFQAILPPQKERQEVNV